MPHDRFDTEPIDLPREPWSRAFWWSFGVCAGAPPLAVLLGWLWSMGESGDPYGIVFFPVLTVPLWIVALGIGLVMAVREPRQTGWEVVLGTLLGAVVGFSLCTGVFIVPDMLGL